MAAARGLSTQDIATIRETLAAGRKPKVMFTASAGQVAGQVGQVVELTDPDGSEDFVVVRFGRDELPFAPNDLTIPPRAAPARKTASPRLTEPAVAESPVPAPRKEESMPTSTVDTSSRRSPSSAKADPDTPAGEVEEPTPVPEPEAALPEAALPVKAPAKKAAKAAKPKAPASLTVTLAYAEGEWTVAAQQGAKALARPYVIKPAEALKMVGMLDVAGVQEAVEQIVATERAEAQQHAETLRAQLAEIEAKLAELG
jgi:hypothetical protein